MTPEQRAFILKAAKAALVAGCEYPTMWACEAAEESSYGTSLLAIQYSNLFGLKAHTHNDFGTANLPTREFLNSEWVSVTAKWEVYPGWPSCFADRLATLKRLANVYPNYKAALDAPDANAYIYAVSKTWSTDPKRAQKVFNIYQDFVTVEPDPYASA